VIDPVEQLEDLSLFALRFRDSQSAPGTASQMSRGYGFILCNELAVYQPLDQLIIEVHLRHRRSDRGRRAWHARGESRRFLR